MIYYTKIQHQLIRLSLTTQKNNSSNNSENNSLQTLLEFLNPLCCNQLIPFDTPKFAAMLDEKGNIQASFIAYRHHDDMLLQTPTPQALGMLLARYKLSSPLKITKTNHQIFACWQNEDSQKTMPNIDTKELMLIADPRNKTDGIKNDNKVHYLIGEEQNCLDYLNENTDSGALEVRSLEEWQAHRIRLGWIDDEYQNHNFLPHHLHYDQLNAIHWKKGCYPGQEICARIHFKGKVKRKIFPFTAQNNIKKDQDIFNHAQKQIGNVITILENPHQTDDASFIGLAFINVTAHDENLTADKMVAIKPFYPAWYQKET